MPQNHSTLNHLKTGDASEQHMKLPALALLLGNFSTSTAAKCSYMTRWPGCSMATVTARSTQSLGINQVHLQHGCRRSCQVNGVQP